MVPSGIPVAAASASETIIRERKAFSLPTAMSRTSPITAAGGGEQQEDAVAVEHGGRIHVGSRTMRRGRKRPASLPGGIPVLIGQHAIDPYGGDPFGGADRVAEGSRIPDGLRIEEHQVGVTAFARFVRDRLIQIAVRACRSFYARLGRAGRCLDPGSSTQAHEERFPTSGGEAGGRWAVHRSRSWSPDAAGCGAHPLQTCSGRSRPPAAGGLPAVFCSTPQARAICSRVCPAISG